MPEADTFSVSHYYPAGASASDYTGYTAAGFPLLSLVLSAGQLLFCMHPYTAESNGAVAVGATIQNRCTVTAAALAARPVTGVPHAA